jgi:hypothetical protein
LNAEEQLVARPPSRRPSASSCFKLAFVVVASLWLSTACLFGCAVGFALGGGFSPAVALIPAFAIVFGVAHSVIGWAQERWNDLFEYKRLRLSASASLGFVVGWAAVFVFEVPNRWSDSRTSWLMWALPTLGCLLCLGAVIAWSGRIKPSGVAQDVTALAETPPPRQ